VFYCWLAGISKKDYCAEMKFNFQSFSKHNYNSFFSSLVVLQSHGLGTRMLAALFALVLSSSFTGEMITNDHDQMSTELELPALTGFTSDTTPTVASSLVTTVVNEADIPSDAQIELAKGIFDNYNNWCGGGHGGYQVCFSIFHFQNGIAIVSVFFFHSIFAQ
jgi:hypothetical protein